MEIRSEMFLKANRSVSRCIEKVLPKKEYEYRIVYSGRSLEILSKNPLEDTRLYIRLVYIGNGIAVDFSNIEFDTRLRHKGKFTSIINDLKQSRSIQEIWVGSVLTPEMHKACQKCEMQYSDTIMGYKYKL